MRVLPLHSATALLTGFKCCSSSVVGVLRNKHNQSDCRFRVCIALTLCAVERRGLDYVLEKDMVVDTTLVGTVLNGLSQVSVLKSVNTRAHTHAQTHAHSCTQRCCPPRRDDMRKGLYPGERYKTLQTTSRLALISYEHRIFEPTIIKLIVALKLYRLQIIDNRDADARSLDT